MQAWRTHIGPSTQPIQINQKIRNPQPEAKKSTGKWTDSHPTQLKCECETCAYNGINKWGEHVHDATHFKEKKPESIYQTTSDIIDNALSKIIRPQNKEKQKKRTSWSVRKPVVLATTVPSWPSRSTSEVRSLFHSVALTHDDSSDFTRVDRAASCNLIGSFSSESRLDTCICTRTDNEDSNKSKCCCIYWVYQILVYLKFHWLIQTKLLLFSIFVEFLSVLGRNSSFTTANAEIA